MSLEYNRSQILCKTCDVLYIIYFWGNNLWIYSSSVFTPWVPPMWDCTLVLRLKPLYWLVEVGGEEMAARFLFCKAPSLWKLCVFLYYLLAGICLQSDSVSLDKEDPKGSLAWSLTLFDFTRRMPLHLIGKNASNNWFVMSKGPPSAGVIFLKWR